MEKFEEAAIKARKRIDIAHHMMTITYPAVQDSKLLLGILENIFLAQANAMSALLYHERLFKRIPPFQDTFESKLNMLQFKCAKQYDINPEEIKMLQEVKEIIANHKKSPFEFAKKDKFVICSNEYKLDTISPIKVKEYLQKTKALTEKMLSYVNKNDI